MEHAFLAALHSYPVKSLGGVSHGAAKIHPWGLEQDRRWMVVTPAGRFITQREHPLLARLRAAARGRVLILTAPGMAPLKTSPEADAPPCVVSVWRDRVQARDAGEAAAAWLSQALALPCRLVHLADTNARKLAAAYALQDDETVSFADAFPVLLTSSASLADLNARLGTPVPMARFRTNLVIDAAPAWAEDSWRRIQIGQVVFRVSKPCDRCVTTTIDQVTGLQPDGNEPLRTLGQFRRDVGGKIMFGQNLVPETLGTLRLGARLHILEVGAPNVAAIDKKKAGGDEASPPDPPSF